MADGRSPHVLVVDDDEALRRLYDDLLKDEGFRITAWQRPSDDLGDVVALAPDAIVLDFLIGGEDAGWRFLERLKMAPATRQVPVLVCTAAQPLVERVQDRLTAWDCRVLPKPFDIDDFVAHLRACLRPASQPRIEPVGGGDHRFWTEMDAESKAQRDERIATLGQDSEVVAAWSAQARADGAWARDVLRGLRGARPA